MSVLASLALLLLGTVVGATAQEVWVRYIKWHRLLFAICAAIALLAIAWGTSNVHVVLVSAGTTLGVLWKAGRLGKANRSEPRTRRADNAAFLALAVGTTTGVSAAIWFESSLKTVAFLIIALAAFVVARTNKIESVSIRRIVLLCGCATMTVALLVSLGEIGKGWLIAASALAASAIGVQLPSRGTSAD